LRYPIENKNQKSTFSYQAKIMKRKKGTSLAGADSTGAAAAAPTLTPVAFPGKL